MVCFPPSSPPSVCGVCRDAQRLARSKLSEPKEPVEAGAEAGGAPPQPLRATPPNAEISVPVETPSSARKRAGAGGERNEGESNESEGDFGQQPLGFNEQAPRKQSGRSAFSSKLTARRSASDVEDFELLEVPQPPPPSAGVIVLSDSD